MRLKPFILFSALPALLAACETYTEKTSPCFEGSREPSVTRTTLFFETPRGAKESSKNCVFEPLPRPE